MSGSLLLRDARLVDGRVTDVEVRDGRVARVEDDLSPAGLEILACEGRLVLPALVEPHFHLDKCHTATEAPVLPSLDAYLEAETDAKRSASAADVQDRAGRVLRRLAALGVATVRSHVDVDSAAGLRGLEGVLAAAAEHRDLIDVQVVAFPQLGVLQDPGTAELLEEALATGRVTAVGGHPQLERDGADSLRQIELVFDLAQRHDVEVDLHCDEADGSASSWIVPVAAETIRRGMQGRVVVAHLASMAWFTSAHAQQAIEQTARARIRVITNPTSSLLFRGLTDPEPRPRGITRVDELLAAGVDVCFGQETLESIFLVTLRHPDPLLTGHVLAHALAWKQPAHMDRIVEMATTGAARCLGLEDPTIRPGGPARLVVLDAETTTQAVGQVPPRRWVVRDGHVVAETETVHRLIRR